MSNVYIVGVGMTAFGRHLDKSEKELTASAVEAALADAGCDRSVVKAAFFGNCVQGFMQGQHMIRGQTALLPLGFQGIPMINVESACATASTALHLAIAYVRSGASDVALAVGTEKMYSSDKQKMFNAFDSGWDIETVAETQRVLREMGKGAEPSPAAISEKPYSAPMDFYAALARYHMSNFGITQRDLAVISAKNHRHAVHNERAQFREAMTADDVLAARTIVYPLTLPMCAPISDGSAAAIVCSESALGQYGFARKRAVRVAASVLRSATKRDASALENYLSRLAAQEAYAVAGLSPADVDVCEVHDATAMGELMQTECLGLCDIGGGGELAASGATTIGGKVPVNPSGGLESKGHPIGATGLGQVFELVSQLRGECGPRQVEGARIALQENGGGIWGVEESAAHIGIYAAA